MTSSVSSKIAAIREQVREREVDAGTAVDTASTSTRSDTYSDDDASDYTTTQSSDCDRSDEPQPAVHAALQSLLERVERLEDKYEHIIKMLKY